MAKKKPADESPKPKQDPSALKVKQLADLLTKAGGRLVTAAQLQKDIDAGMPTNGDGTVNLIHSTAWLARQVD